MKYVLTLWTDWYDYDGLTQSFKILLETDSREEVLTQAPIHLDRFIQNELKERDSWSEEYFDPRKRPGCGACPPRIPPNANNNVIESYRRKVSDGTGYNSTYYYLDVVEFPDGVTIGPELFGDSDEVSNFFDKNEIGHLTKFCQLSQT